MLTTAPGHAAVAIGRFNRILSATAAAACVALAAYKFFLTGRLNVNWDEFYYLNFVHALARGDLNLLMQGAYTHLFAWLPAVGGDEMAQILAARVVMVVLLCFTTLLVWRLGRRWLVQSELSRPACEEGTPIAYELQCEAPGLENHRCYGAVSRESGDTPVDEVRTDRSIRRMVLRLLYPES